MEHRTVILIDIIFASCIAITLLTGFDFITFTIKSAPKSSTLNRRQWRIGLLTLIAAISIYIVYYKHNLIQ